ncbi:hypothetical protein MMC13_005769 [Lambiella insularis]|nr:hypothetical protein [Lambiella insularis]
MPSLTFFLLLFLLYFNACTCQNQAQAVPQTPKAPGTFSNGAACLIAEPPLVDDIPDEIYGARPIDIPFFRLYHGNINFFPAGQLNTPTANRDLWASENDNANQSACGIPDNAFFISKVAIHPYFLKYADFSRYCMQDVCISFWEQNGKSDMMLKVTDICSTDPNDPTHCATPSDIKIDRTKAMIMEGINDASDPRLTGNAYPEPIWWFFTKCWADGLAQPAYLGNNWFTTPPLPNNLNWSMSTASQQYKNNQVSYAAKGWPTYPNGGYNTERDSTISPPISDWVPGQELAWSPIAGGVGWGQPQTGASSPPPSPPPSNDSSTTTSSTSVSSTSAAYVAPPQPAASSLSTSTAGQDSSTKQSSSAQTSSCQFPVPSITSCILPVD